MRPGAGKNNSLFSSNTLASVFKGVVGGDESKNDIEGIAEEED